MIGVSIRAQIDAHVQHSHLVHDILILSLAFPRFPSPSTLTHVLLIFTNAITGVQLVDNPSAPFTCDSCDYAKLTRKPIRKERQAPLAKVFGDEVHTDVWGPAPVQSLGG